MERKQRPLGKWRAIVFSESRVKVVNAIFKHIENSAKNKQLPHSPEQMSKLLKGKDVNVCRGYIRSMLRPDCELSLPIESIIGICEGYNIPLSTIFNPALFEDNADS